jgi:SAM-dependent methyltransferase
VSYLPKDVLLLPESSPEGDGAVWVAMNVFTRSCVAIDAAGLTVLSTFSCEKSTTPASHAGVFKVWEIGRFSNEDGLLADPSRYFRDSKDWKAPADLQFDQFIQVLKKNFILIDDLATYKKYFGRKTSVLDGGHLGNLHDQIGSFMMLSRRRSPSQWWVEQKFKPDLSSTRDDTLYGAVENNYLKTYFPKKLKKGSKVLDLGCGVGYFSALMAETGAQVLGVDPNAEYIKMAKANFGETVVFESSNIGHDGDLAKYPDESFDFIFMSDTLLFYFIPISEKETHSLKVVLKDIRRLLKPGGTFCSLESHPVFYQAPWLGSEERPFTFKTEYQTHVSGVVPSFSEMGKAFTENGFSISWIDELYASQPYTGPKRNFNFAKEFPLWILFELQKNPLA